MMSGEMGDGIISEKKISMTCLEIQEEWVCVDEKRERYKGMVGDKCINSKLLNGVGHVYRYCEVSMLKEYQTIYREFWIRIEGLFRHSEWLVDDCIVDSLKNIVIMLNKIIKSCINKAVMCWAKNN